MKGVGRNDPCWCGSGLKYKRCHWPVVPTESSSVDEPIDDDGGFTVVQQRENRSVFYLGEQEEDSVWIAGGFVEVAGTRIWKPTLLAETTYRQEAEAHLRERYSAGRLTSKSDINEAIQWQASWMKSVIDEALIEVGDLRLLDFLVFQHDQWTIVYQATTRKRREGGAVSEREEWILEKAPLARRALKYLVERVLQVVPTREDSGASEERTMQCAERALIVGEEYFLHSGLSDQTYYLFPDQTTMTVHEPGDEYFWSLTLDEETNSLVEQGKNRIARWQAADLRYSGVLGNGDAIQVLDAPMASALGFSMSDAISILKTLAIDTQPASGAFRAYVPLADAISALSSNTGVSADRVELALSGWLLSKALLDDEGRDPLRPNQRMRMLTRPLLLVEDDPMGPHIVVPREFLAEAVTMTLERLMRWKELPSPWEAAAGGSVSAAIEQHASGMQKEFERITAQLLAEVGFVGSTVSQGTLRPWGFELPEGMGDIDYLGINTQARVVMVAECKHISGATDPVRWRDERDDFLRAKTGYVPKLLAKYDYVVRNTGAAVGAIAGRARLEPLRGDWSVLPIIVTAGEHLVGPFCAASGVTASSLHLLLEDLPAQMRAMTWPHSVVSTSGQ